MSKLSKQQKENRRAKVHDTSLPLADRKKAHNELMNGMLNPVANFDPQTFDPMSGVEHYEVKKRDREDLPRRLPTMGMKPKKILEGQMVGMFESKQDLYLMIAHLSERISDLEDQLNP